MNQALNRYHVFRLCQYLWLPVMVFLVHLILSFGFDAYDRVDQIDVPMHFMGGVAIAYWVSQMLLYSRREHLLRLSGRFVMVLAVIGSVGTATVLWEFAEFAADFLYRLGAQRSIGNVMKDQFMGLLGGSVYLLWARPEKEITKEKTGLG